MAHAAALESPRRRRSLSRRGDRHRRRVERIAQVSYDAGERGILELLDAYPDVGVGASASGHARRGGSQGAEIELEFVSGWEIP